MPDPASNRVTKLLKRLDTGEASVAEELLPLVYDELRGIANRLFAGQARGHTLQPTALVHEAWLKLAGHEQVWETRGHFFSVAARAMRQVLTDHARALRTERRGKAWRRVTLDDQQLGQERSYDLVDIDDALQGLATANERHGRVVELKLFAGLSLPEIAAVLNVTPRTVQLDWRSARAYLSHVLDEAIDGR